MPLHNKKDHMDCVYYATDESALFRQYRLSDSTDISDINESHSVLLYLAEGCLQITLGNLRRAPLNTVCWCFCRKI